MQPMQKPNKIFWLILYLDQNWTLEVKTINSIPIDSEAKCQYFKLLFTEEH